MACIYEVLGKSKKSWGGGNLISGMNMNVNYFVCVGGRWIVRVDTGRGNGGYCYKQPGEILRS